MEIHAMKFSIFVCFINLVLGANGEDVLAAHEQELVATTTVMADMELLEQTTIVTSGDANEITADETFTTTTTAIAPEDETTIQNDDFEIIMEVIITDKQSPPNATEEEQYLETTTIATEDVATTTLASVDLESYALEQMNFILDHILQTSYDFVSKVLQQSGNSITQRDKLKRCAETLHSLLSFANDETSDRQQSVDMAYNLILQKLAFLKSRDTKYLHKYIPPEWLHVYKTEKQEISIWIDKAAEQMHEEFNNFVNPEDDSVKFQYFNESFDDIPRAHEIHHKLAILLDLVKIAVNKKEITFMDLYMQ